MKIESITATPLAVPLAQEFHWAAGAQRGVNLVLFSVRTDEGVVGSGEAFAEDPVAVASYGEMLGSQLIGRSPANMEDIQLSVWTEGRWRFWPHFTQMVFAGIEVACWDALGKHLGVPTATFFGGRLRESVEFFAFVQGGTPEALGRHARKLSMEGYETFYLKVGRPGQDDEASVAAVRKAVGSEPRLRIDPNEAWSPSVAVDRIRRLEQYDLDWVEQPVPAGQVSGLRDVRRRVHTKIAADQAVFTTSELLNVLQQEAADVIVQGSHDAGGLWQLKQQSVLINAFGLSLNRHAFMESDISLFANLQVLAGVPNLTTGSQMMSQLLAERLTTARPVVVKGGEYRIPDGPGHGFTLDPDAVARAHERFAAQGPYVVDRRVEPRLE